MPPSGANIYRGEDTKPSPIYSDPNKGIETRLIDPNLAYQDKSYVDEGQNLSGQFQKATGYGRSYRRGKWRDYVDWSDSEDFNISTYDYSDLNPDVMNKFENIFGGGSSALDFLNWKLGATDPVAYNRKGTASWLSRGERRGRTAEFQPHIDWGDEMDVDYKGHDAGALDAQMDALGVTGIQDFVNIFDPESIAAGIEFKYGLNPGAINPESIIGMESKDIMQAERQYYDPLEQAEYSKLADSLVRDMSRVGTGGFAGSGARDVMAQDVENMYRAGYGELIASIEDAQQEAYDDMMEKMYGWDEIGSRMAYGG